MLFRSKKVDVRGRRGGHWGEESRCARKVGVGGPGHEVWKVKEGNVYVFIISSWVQVGLLYAACGLSGVITT